MQTSITKWGNSLAVRLPKPFIEQIGLNQNQKVEITLQDDKIVLSKPKQNLKDLLKGVTKKNNHQETDTGQIIGNEIW